MEELLIIGFVAGFAFYAGYKWCEFRLITMMLSMLTDKELDELQRLKNKLDVVPEEEANRIIEDASKKINLKMIKLEIVEGQHFFYDLNNNFICQGNTKEQAVANFLLVDRVSKRACVVDDSGETFFIVDGVITKEQPR